MSENDDIPEYVRNARARTDDERWEALNFQYSEYRDFLYSVRFETKEEALGEKVDKKWRSTAPKWHDPELNLDIPAHNLAPYINAIDHELLSEHVAGGRKLAIEIEPDLKNRRLSLEFLQKWGVLSECVGAIKVVYFSDPDDMSSVRAGASQSLDAHRLWFSVVFLDLKKKHGGDRKTVETRLLKIVTHLKDSDAFVNQGFGNSWFIRFWGDPKTSRAHWFSNAFSGKNLPACRMPDIVARGGHDIPPTDVEKYTP